MRLLLIVLALIIGLFGLRLFFTGLRTIILFIKMEQVPLKAKERAVRDIVVGILFLILTFAMIT